MYRVTSKLRPPQEKIVNKLTPDSTTRQRGYNLILEIDKQGKRHVVRLYRSVHIRALSYLIKIIFNGNGEQFWQICK